MTPPGVFQGLVMVVSCGLTRLAVWLTYICLCGRLIFQHFQSSTMQCNHALFRHVHSHLMEFFFPRLKAIVRGGARELLDLGISREVVLHHHLLLSPGTTWSGLSVVSRQRWWASNCNQEQHRHGASFSWLGGWLGSGGHCWLIIKGGTIFYFCSPTKNM